MDNSKNRSRTLYRILRLFAKPEDNNPLPDINKEKLSDEFADYFLNTIDKIKEPFKGEVKHSPPISSCTMLPHFKSLTEEQVFTLIQHMNHTTCVMDPCNKKFLMKFKDTLIGTITKIINISLSTSQYLNEWKIAVVRSLIKVNIFTHNTRITTHPINNLSFMSKLTEKAAQTELMTHFTEQNLLPKHQNAYRNISQQQLPYLMFVTAFGPTWKTKTYLYHMP